MQDPKLMLADAEVTQDPVVLGGKGGKSSAATMLKLASMLASTFQPSNHSKSYKPKNLLSVDGTAKSEAAQAKRLKRQQRNIKNASV